MSDEAQNQVEGSKQEEQSEFATVKARLEEIANAVDDEGISLDEALDLYEEAVSLGLHASDLLEVGISPDEGSDAEGGAPAPDAADDAANASDAQTVSAE